ncbi:FGGY-family carbohydrate kinase [Loktanella sp. SALINAS62]|uniref:xylulokinase n=1 Tax=Loktanella sp. SALINAS62 TaxID=2706124 RepID=UPI001B8AB716|nr:FGGY-family carbohydrate kinase [Loktanella sp. SALINAS62]MBS1302762.1 FGGY-family carbohydrate kinase [Loktanella sp. SALINAS62]
MKNARIVGIDVGTTSVKAAVIDEAGQVISRFSHSYPTHWQTGGAVEQDPQDWVRLVHLALAEMDLDGVVAAGLTSQVNTHVFADADGTALLPAIVWQDGRAQSVAIALDARVTTEDKLKWWGAPMPIDASHACSRMAWVAENMPDIWQQTRWVMLPKDYVAFHLTGVVATDAVSSIGLVDQTLGYVLDILDLVPGARDRVAPIAGIMQSIGLIKEGPLKGVPLICGTMDAWAGLVGTGGAQDGTSMYLSGTSEIMGISSQTVTPTSGVIVFPDYDGIRLHAAPTQSGGDAKMWFAQSNGLKLDEMSALVAQTSPSTATPLFLPQLQGERAPLWDADLRAAFLGVSRATARGDFARAVYEGVAMSARMALEALQASAGVKSDVILCGGGGFRSASWNQIRADILGAELRVLELGEPGVLGAAMMAGVGAGHFTHITEALGALATYDRTYTPDPSQRFRTEDLHSLYCDAIRQTGDLGKRLTQINAR